MIIESLITVAKTIVIDQTVYFGKKLLTASINERKLQKSLREAEDYLQLYVKNFAKIKTLTTPLGEWEELDKIFVPLDVYCDSTRIGYEEIRNRIVMNSDIIFTGGAGSGKSMLMKYLFMDYRKYEKLPIFINARDVDIEGDGSFEKAIANQFEIIYSIQDHSFLYRLLKSGSIAIFLDGLDESNIAIKSYLFAQVESFCYRFPNSILITSSRPESVWLNLSTLNRFKMADLTRNQKIDIVRKLNVEEECQEMFLNYIYENEIITRGFTDRPLLLVAAFLSYQYDTNIPPEEFELLKNAVDAITKRHDSLKGAWTRRHKSGLTKGQIANLLERVGFQMYMNVEYTLRKDQFQLLLESELEKVVLPGLENPDTDSVYYDLVVATGILIEDDGIVQFIHRAFLQYMFTCFLARLDAKGWARVYESRFSISAEWLVLEMLKHWKEELFLRYVMVPFHSQWTMAGLGCDAETVGSWMNFYVLENISKITGEDHAQWNYSMREGLMMLRSFVKEYSDHKERNIRLSAAVSFKPDDAIVEVLNNLNNYTIMEIKEQCDEMLEDSVLQDYLGYFADTIDEESIVKDGFLVIEQRYKQLSC
jgi:hypothetical protein